MLHTTKLSARHQITVPPSVRQALQLQPGDCVGFELIGNEVRLRRATPFDLAFNQALSGTLSEWDSAADDRAIKGLLALA